MSLNFLNIPNYANPQNNLPLASLESVQQGLSAIGLMDVQQLPETFDLREKGILEPTNQGVCGNCWAISSTNALTDKYRIFNHLSDLELNQLVTTMCSSTHSKGCNGGNPYYTGKFFEQIGATVNRCGTAPSWKEFYEKASKATEEYQKAHPNAQPADIQAVSNQNMTYVCGGFNNCPLEYKAVKNSTRNLTVQDADGRINPASTIHNIKVALMSDGPVVSVFQVYNDFMVGNSVIKKPDGSQYKWDATNGVYIVGKYNKDLDEIYKNMDPKLKGKFAKFTRWSDPAENGKAYHAVEIVGWSKDPKYGEYWIVKNSWGTQWADGGYWKHGMWSETNKNTCFIDIPNMYSADSSAGGCVTWSIEVDESRGIKIGNSKGSVWSRVFYILLIVVAVCVMAWGVYLLIKKTGGFMLTRERVRNKVLNHSAINLDESEGTYIYSPSKRTVLRDSPHYRGMDEIRMSPHVARRRNE